ncbi:hypothetical protein AWZ03_013100 [Drosophila navojoa]|uniref:Uncharacterized protein n=1 Tax=Drosophila navojoa TaxID=7232 RepID=A0A484AVR9_DRONA|nr:hypothetical protein AWZ03_013100 [Drosophila navojoa]
MMDRLGTVTAQAQAQPQQLATGLWPCAACTVHRAPSSVQQESVTTLPLAMRLRCCDVTAAIRQRDTTLAPGRGVSGQSAAGAAQRQGVEPDVEGEGEGEGEFSGVWQLDLESLLQIPEATLRQHVSQSSTKTTPTTMSTPTCRTRPRCGAPLPGLHTPILPLPLARPLPLQLGWMLEGGRAGSGAEDGEGAGVAP